jgi:thermostable 8-oxoguanine DNA glycosylase
MEAQKLEVIFKLIYETLREHYQKHGENIDAEIAEAISESRRNRNEDLLYKRLVFSIHNANWKAKSQQTFWEERSQNYEKALHNYDYRKVKDLRLEDISGKSKGLIDSSNKLKACLKAAKFLHEIAQSGISPLQFFDKFGYENSTVYERWALVCILDQSIKGIGTALACDFLKEIGYLNYGKPDVHIKRILKRIGIFDELKNDFVASSENFLYFRILDRIAEASNKTVFEVDKVFWLFGTGFNNANKQINGICVNEKQKTKCDSCLLNEKKLCERIFEDE